MNYLATGLKKAARIAARALVSDKPHHAQLLITRQCNYQCLGCNVWKEQDKNELPTKDIKRILDILKDLGIVELVLSGGEPLLREDIGEIIDYASRLFIITVYDNGSMAYKKIETLRNVDFIAISIDSLDEKKHDYIKNVSGAWKRAMETVELLHKEGLKVAVTPTISQLNINEIVDITNYFTKKGIPVWYSIYSYDTVSRTDQVFKIGKENDEFIIKDKQAMVRLCDELLKNKKTNKQILITDKLLKTVKALYQEEKREWICGALKNFLVVDHLGRVAGCHSHAFAGSIFDLPEKWKSEEFKKLRETYKQCTQCTYLCYIFYSLYGTPSGHISLAKEQWRNAKLILKKNKPPS